MRRMLAAGILFVAPLGCNLLADIHERDSISTGASSSVAGIGGASKIELIERRGRRRRRTCFARRCTYRTDDAETGAIPSSP